MEKSEQLKEITQGFVNALLKAEHDYYAQHISQQEGVVMIGSDDREWAEGYQSITERLRPITENMQGCTTTDFYTQAYQQGNFGLSVSKFTLCIPNGTKVPMRLTMAFTQEKGKWKVIQWHDSVGVPNEASMGEDFVGDD
ncbi:MAG: nuclear transport factor 2 family protein [Candidatus Hodarchaeota archaeon]